MSAFSTITKTAAVAIVMTAVTTTVVTNAQQPTYTTCKTVLAIPGNKDNVKDSGCGICAKGTQPYYPCDNPSLCYCEADGIPEEYVLPFTYCDNVIAVPNNADNVDDARCAVCSKAATRYYPCDQPDMLCKCGSSGGGTTATSPSGGGGGTTPRTTRTTTTPAPTPAPSGPFATCGKAIAIPGNKDGVTDARCNACSLGKQSFYPCDNAALCYCEGSQIPQDFVLSFTFCNNVVAVPNNANGVTDGQCSSCNNGRNRYYPCDQPDVLCKCSGGETDPTGSTSATSATSATTTTSSPPSPNNSPFATCSKVIAIPGNRDGIPAAGCGVCAKGAQTYYPCDNPSLCYCEGSVIPAEYLLPFTYCDNVVSVPNNAHGVSDARCAVCNNAAKRDYPCDQPDVLCRCGNSPYAPTEATTTTKAPTQPTEPTPAPTGPFATCKKSIAIPGNPDGVTDAGCGVCANGGRTYYPCDNAALCYCEGSQIPSEYVLPFSYCTALSVPFNSKGVTDAQCAVCSFGAYRYYPCEKRGDLCRCSDDPTNAPPATTATTKAPTTPTTRPTSTTNAPTAPPGPTTPAPTSPPPTNAGDLDNDEFLGNTIEEFKLRKPPQCPSRITDDLKSCGGHDYEQVLCMTQFFYMAQAGGKSSIDWRGDCFTDDGISNTGGTNSPKNLTLGWFDAGDFVKFGLPMSYSALMLAWGALEFPSGYRSGVQLRALLYNLRVYAFYILEGWDPVNKRLIAQIGSGGADHSTWASCKNRRNEQRPVYYISPTCPGTEVAAETASALAAIALLLRAEEGTASAALQSRLSTAAKEIYDFGNTYRGSYTQCVSDASSFYASFSGYNDELALASTWMASLKAVGLISSSTDYIAAAKSNYNYPWFISWDNKYLAVALRLSQLTTEARYRDDVRVQIQECVQGSTTRGGLWNIQQWGNLRYNANEAFTIRLANKLGIVADSYSVHAKRVIDYMLGTNPAGRSYVVGFGVNPPVRAHHRAAHDGTTTTNPIDNRHVIYGALVGGPYGDDTYFDDRDNYQMTEVATDYNALFAGAIASFVGQNCRTDFPPTVPGPAPPSTDAPQPGTNRYTIDPVKIEEFWLQVTITPTPYSAVIEVSNSVNKITNTYPLEGPKWGSHWTFGPSVSVTGGDRIAVIVTPTASSSSGDRLLYVVREGAVGISAVLSGDVDSFSAPAFAAAVANSLNIDSTRVEVNAVQAGSVAIDFSILAMNNQLYTTAGRQLCLAGSAGNCQIMATVMIASQLNDPSSSQSVALQGAVGATGPLSVLRSPTESYDDDGGGPSNDDANKDAVSGGTLYIAVGAGVGAVVLAAAVIVGAVLYSKRLKSRRVGGGDRYGEEDGRSYLDESDLETKSAVHLNSSPKE